MAKPQIENGYTKIANELLEAILRAKFQYQELKILLAIVRLTYGWSRKEAEISYGTLARLTGFKRQNVLIACQSLEKDFVLIIKKGEGRFKTNVLSVNKNFSDWAGRLPVDNSKQVSCVDMTGCHAYALQGVMPTHDIGVMPTHSPLNKPKESIKETLKKVISAVEKNGNENQSQKQKLSKLLKGQESEITGTDPRGLVGILTKAGYEQTRAWGAIVQARRKDNPAAYLISILADPKYQIADVAYEQAKLEMRKWRY